MASSKEDVKLDVPLVHSPAQFCHIDSLAMILKRLGYTYEAWYMGATSGQFFGLGYFPKPNFIMMPFGIFPLKCLLTFLKEQGYVYQYDEGKSWDKAWTTLKDFLRKDTPVLVVTHMGWLSYNKEYEFFQQVGGVVDHYVVITGFRDDEIVYVNDPHPDLHRKDAELPINDFQIGWMEKLEEIQSIRCPMLTVTGRKWKPEPKKILMQSLQRALKQLNTKSGPVGLAGLKKASVEVPRLLRKDTPAINNSISEYAFFTFRVAEQNRKELSKFLNYAASELNANELNEAGNAITEASKCYTNLRKLFMERIEAKKQSPDIADDVGALLAEAYRNEKRCVEKMLESF